MAQKQFLHELLKEDQEPFRLKNYIADRRSRLKKPSPPPANNSQLGKRKPINPSTNILCKHACFLSFQSSPDVRKSPFFDFPSPAKSPCKSPNGAVFLHIPSKTAALLVEAAMRIHKQQQQKEPKAQSAKNAGLGLLGSFLKRLKDRSKTTKARATITHENDDVEGTVFTMSSCSCSNRRPSSSANWTDTNDFDASTSSCASEFSDTRFFTSPFRFNLLKSPPPSARRTPEFCSPAASPINQEMENYISRNSDNVQGEEEEEDKEQCSPVSVLDPPFEDDAGRLCRDADEEDDDYDLQCSYENVQRAKQQLLYRLRRFEKLAELDAVELETDSAEGSDHEERSDTMSADMKKLLSDLITEEKNECDSEVAMGRVCNKLDSWGEVESNTIDMMVGFDFKGEFDGWTRFNEQREEISAEIEVAVFGILVEELSQELFFRKL